jgi:hypothetical protein
MNNTILIIGQSGSGKSTAIRTLDPATTFVINVLDKPLPFRDFKQKYSPIQSVKDSNGNKSGQTTGNYYSVDDWSLIVKCIEMVNNTRPDITTLIIDDWQYILAYEFIRRVSEKGFEKFSELASHGWQTINACMNTRSDLTCFILAHSDVDNTGRAKCKTIGKMLDEKITIEGLFTTVLHSRVVDGSYYFQTNYDGEYLAKSPMDMFEEMLIPNDLALVKKAIETYFNEAE